MGKKGDERCSTGWAGQLLIYRRIVKSFGARRMKEQLHFRHWMDSGKLDMISYIRKAA
jgi:hypothetical protein